MICPNCGTENEEGYVFCSNCGTKRADAMVSSFMSNSDLADADETVVAQLGNGYISNAITSRRVGSIGATLTNRRVYLKGRFYNDGNSVMKSGIFRFWYRFRDLFKRRMNDQVLDVRDITGTWFEFVDDLWYLVMTFVWGLCLAYHVILTIVLRIRYSHLNRIGEHGSLETTRKLKHMSRMTIIYHTGFLGRYSFIVIMSLLIILFVINLVSYIKSRHTDFCIEYAGGMIRFNADLVGIPAVRDFHKQIRRVKDRHMDELEGRK